MRNIEHNLVDIVDITSDQFFLSMNGIEKLAENFIALGGLFVTPPVLVEESINQYRLISGIEQFEAAQYAVKIDPKIEKTNAFIVSPENEEAVKKQLEFLNPLKQPKPSKPRKPRRLTKHEQLNARLVEITGNPDVSAKKYTKKELKDLKLGFWKSGYFVDDQVAILDESSIWIEATLSISLMSLEADSLLANGDLIEKIRNRFSDQSEAIVVIPTPAVAEQADTPAYEHLHLQLVGEGPLGVPAPLQYDAETDTYYRESEEPEEPEDDDPISSTGTALASVAAKQAQVIPLIVLSCDVPTYENFSRKRMPSREYIPIPILAMIIMSFVFIARKIWEAIPEQEAPTLRPLVIEGKQFLSAARDSWATRNKKSLPNFEHEEIEFHPEGEYCDCPDDLGNYTAYLKPTYEDILIGQKILILATEDIHSMITAVSDDRQEFAIDGPDGDEEWHTQHEALIHHELSARQIEIPEEKFFPQVKTLGSSEFASVLGLSKFSHGIDVYMRKLGLVPEKNASQLNAAQKKQQSLFQRGHDFEPFIGKLYEEKTGNQLTDPQKEFIHPNYGWMTSHPDWMFDNCPIDAKSVNYQRALWERDPTTGNLVWGPDGSDEVSQDCIIQAHGQMLMTGASKAIMAVAFMNDDVYEKTSDKQKSLVDFRIYHIERNQDIIDLMLPKLVDFWENHVLKQVPPLFDFLRKDVLKKQVRFLNNKVNDESIILPLSKPIRFGEIDYTIQTLQADIVQSQKDVHMATLALSEAKLQLEAKLALMESQLGCAKEGIIPDMGTYTRSKKLRRAYEKPAQQVVESVTIQCRFQEGVCI